MEILPQGMCWGIPRGGAVVAGLTGLAVDRWEDAEFLVDDILDSGQTKAKWEEKTGKRVYCLFEKTDPNTWLVFPWEEPDPTADLDNLATRLLQHAGLPQPPGSVLAVRQTLQLLIGELQYVAKWTPVDTALKMFARPTEIRHEGSVHEKEERTVIRQMDNGEARC